MSMSEPSGDMADQADALIVAAEREAIRAALEGRTPLTEGNNDARVERIRDEPSLDLGDGDDSDDPLHAGGDDASQAAGPQEPERGREGSSVESTGDDQIPT